jgi:AraC-like DNA-binding protein
VATPSILASLRDLVTSMVQRPGEATWIEDSWLFRTTAVTQPLGSTSKPILALVLQGAKVSALGETVYEYRQGQFLIVTVDLPLVSHITRASAGEPFVAVGLPLRPDVIASLLLEEPGPAVAGATRHGRPETGPALAVSDADDDLLGAIERLLRLARNPRDGRVLSPGIIREIHWRLLTGPQGALVREAGTPDSRLRIVARAISWLQQNYDQPMRADQLARQVGVSVAGLNRHFRAVTSMSPLQYQKTLRLQQARLALLNSAGDVGRVGHQVGYQSVSQFSREYRRMFGSPPSADAVRLQAADFGPDL